MGGWGYGMKVPAPSRCWPRLFPTGTAGVARFCGKTVFTNICRERICYKKVVNVLPSPHRPDLHRLSLYGALLVLAGVLFISLGSSPLGETDEGFAANRAASIHRHHTIMLSYDDVDTDLPQFFKPPLVYWTIAGLYKIIGFNMWAARLPTALCAFGLCILLYRISREHWGSWCGFWALLLPCTVSVLYVHMRTAMLDVPVFFFTLLGVYLFAYGPRSAGRSLLAGVAVGAAILTKGPAGAIAFPVALAMRCVRGPRDRNIIPDTARLLAAGLLPCLAFYAATPGPYKPMLIRGIFSDNGQQAIVDRDWLLQIRGVGQVLLLGLRWHVPAAAIGFLLLLARARDSRNRQGLILAAAISIPVLFAVGKLSILYPRYLIPVDVFILIFSAAFCGLAPRLRVPGLALLPFAAVAPLLEPGVLSWIPAAAAVAVFVALLVPAIRRHAAAVPIASMALLLSIVVPSALSPKSRDWRIKDVQRYKPEIEVLARAAAPLIPEDEKIIAAGGYKCHNLLFHSGRAVQSFSNLLLENYEPGLVRYGIFPRKLQGMDIPHVGLEPILETNEWALVRITISNDVAGARACVVASVGHRDKIRTSLDLLGARYSRFKMGYLVTGLPESRSSILPTTEWKTNRVAVDGYCLQPGGVVEFTWSGPVQVDGVNLHTARKDGWVGTGLEVLDTNREWRAIGAIGREPEMGWVISGGRLRDTGARFVQWRFPPMLARGVRIRRISGNPLCLARVEVIGAGAGGDADDDADLPLEESPAEE